MHEQLQHWIALIILTAISFREIFARNRGKNVTLISRYDDKLKRYVHV